jgi:hypothetical protein
MKGDFSKDSFVPGKHFTRVLMQQGRVMLDSDSNESSAISQRYLQALARDLIGPWGAPAGADGGFLLAADANGLLTISPGRYYVDGLLVENDTGSCTYKTQPDYPVPEDDPLVLAAGSNANQRFLIYLDVWERHITSIEDPDISEVALAGTDTCTRARLVWQVRALPLTERNLRELHGAGQERNQQLKQLWRRRAQLQKEFERAGRSNGDAQIKLLKQIRSFDEQLARQLNSSPLTLGRALLGQLPTLSAATMAARVAPAQNSKYQGTENHLYRVEIHRSGRVGGATFQWSRDNGSIATALLGIDGNDLHVASARGFSPGGWVELSDDRTDLLGIPGTLVSVVGIEGDVLSINPAAPLSFGDFASHPKVRRWDHLATDRSSLAGDNAVPLRESPANATGDEVVWLDLEAGIQIQFSADGVYRTGDYWLIPARVATANIEWPHRNDSTPDLLPPRGVEHHYAPLGLVLWSERKLQVTNLRCEFPPLSCIAQTSLPTGTNFISLDILETPTPSRPARPRRKKRAPTRRPPGKSRKRTR